MSELFDEFCQNNQIDKIEEWAVDIGQHYGQFLSEEDIIRHMDFDHDDLPARKRAVVAHDNTQSHQIDDEFIRMEFRIGVMGTSGWHIPEKYNISELVSSEHYIKHEHKMDATYVDFQFRLPRMIREFQRAYENQMEKQLERN